MKENKAQIIELAWIVHDGLNNYIQVHNKIYKNSATFFSLMKDLFGFVVPMSDLLLWSEALIPEWESIQLKLENFKSVSYTNLSQDEQKYIDLLSQFVNALQLTVISLVERQRLMERGSRSFMKNRISWRDFKEKDNAYKNSIIAYTVIGYHLNESDRIVF